MAAIHTLQNFTLTSENHERLKLAIELEWRDSIQDVLSRYSLFSELCYQTTALNGSMILRNYENADGFKEATGQASFGDHVSDSRILLSRLFNQHKDFSKVEVIQTPWTMLEGVQLIAEDILPFKEELTFNAIEKGFTDLHFDGVPFFSDNHIGYDRNGNQTAYSNFDSGTEPTWLLADLSSSVKRPLIFQTTREPELFTITDPASDYVSVNDKYIVKASMMCNASLIDHRLLSASRKPFTFPNIMDMYKRMMQQFRRNGKPLGKKPTTLIIGADYVEDALGIQKDEAIQGSPIIDIGDGTLLNVKVTPWLNF